MDKLYVDAVRLLLETAPFIFRTQDFALKGGTALNLFVRTCPGSQSTSTWFTPTAHSDEEALSEISDKLKECICTAWCSRYQG